MDGSNLHVLVEAKKELLNQLTTTILPLGLDTMENLYAESVIESGGKMVLKNFQERIAGIPKWNNYQIDAEVGKAVDRCGGCLDEMIAAVFVATVKIISSVRLSRDSRKVSLKIPTNDVFLLGVYTNIAKRIYENPYVFEKSSRHERRKDLVELVDGVVEETVKEMLPINQILKTYLHKNPMDIMKQESEDIHTAEINNVSDDENIFPGVGEGLGGEEPTQEDDENEGPIEPEEPMGMDMGSEEMAPELGERMEEDESTKKINFRDTIGRRDPPPIPSSTSAPLNLPPSDEDDFINPGARR